MSMTDGTRTVLLVAHTGRAQAVNSARFVASRLAADGLSVRVLDTEAATLDCGADVVPVSPQAAAGAEVVIVVGGDGTLLRAAEVAYPADAPLLGINLGHVGFLAEAEHEDLAETVDRVVACRYHVESRMTVDVTVRQNAAQTVTWALNEATVEKSARVGMAEVVVEVDGRPVSTWDCDGVICATPTGSTGYAFSAGGPVVWPEVDALVVVPICAHALFARALVVSPAATLAVEVIGGTVRTGQDLADRDAGARPWRGGPTGAVLWCDGRRSLELPPGARVEVRRGARPLRLARLDWQEARAGQAEPGAALAEGAGASFTDRLVKKFRLPVTGWRGRQEPLAGDQAARGVAPAGGREASRSDA